MKNQQYYIYLTSEEFSELIKQLIKSRNELLYKNRYTDAIDDLIIKIGKSKKQKIKQVDM